MLFASQGAAPSRPSDGSLGLAASHRQKALIGSSVPVLPIGMPMPTIDTRYGRQPTGALRVGTADLVLDGIDSYEPEDATAICRLVETDPPA